MKLGLGDVVSVTLGPSSEAIQGEVFAIDEKTNTLALKVPAPPGTGQRVDVSDCMGLIVHTLAQPCRTE
jgi:hypothetical protein